VIAAISNEVCSQRRLEIRLSGLRPGSSIWWWSRAGVIWIIHWHEPSDRALFWTLRVYVRLVRFDRAGLCLGTPPRVRRRSSRKWRHRCRSWTRPGGLAAALFGGAVEAGLCAYMAASYPERVSALSCWSTWRLGRPRRSGQPHFSDFIRELVRGRMLPCWSLARGRSPL